MLRKSLDGRELDEADPILSLSSYQHRLRLVGHKIEAVGAWYTHKAGRIQLALGRVQFLAVLV